MTRTNVYHNLLGRVSSAMKDKGYCLPPTVQGVHTDDTGAVIAVVLYFIMKEPKISKKKIKCYLLLLNRICQKKGRGDIFRWQLEQLNTNSIQKFIDELIDFMKKRKLIRLNGNSKSQLVVHEVPTFFTEILPLIPSNVIVWLNSIVNVCKKKTGQDMENSMLPSNKITKKTEVQKLQDTKDKKILAYSKKRSAVSSDDSALGATVEECIKLIEEHEAEAKN